MSDQQSLPELPLTPESSAALVAQRCADDPAFRNRFEADPRGCLEELIGQKLPDELEVVLHQNDTRTWHVPVPGDELTASCEISEEAMASISGGFTFTTAFVVIGISAAVVTALIAGGFAGAIAATE